MKYKDYDNLDNILTENVNPIELYIMVLNSQLETLPSNSVVYETIKSCKELAQSILTYKTTTNKMANYKLVKETKIDGEISFSIEKDGKYISRSICSTLEEAEALLDILLKGGNLETLKEVIKSIDIDEN